MRPAHDTYDAEVRSCATPIYDALYREHRRLFRAVPGDRSGETGQHPDDPTLLLARQDRLERPELSPQQAPRTYADHGRGALPSLRAQQAGHAPNGQGRVATMAPWTAAPRGAA